MAEKQQCSSPEQVVSEIRCVTCHIWNHTELPGIWNIIRNYLPPDTSEHTPS